MKNLNTKLNELKEYIDLFDSTESATCFTPSEKATKLVKWNKRIVEIKKEINLIMRKKQDEMDVSIALTSQKVKQKVLELQAKADMGNWGPQIKIILRPTGKVEALNVATNQIHETWSVMNVAGWAK